MNPVNKLINKILPYSAMNNIAKKPPPYSILKPETNSDSDSAKSKGVRFVSAKITTNHLLNITLLKIKNKFIKILLKDKDISKKDKDISKKDKDTSYEIV